jgi:rubrerythrin
MTFVKRSWHTYRKQATRCPACGFLLTANATRCPACGFVVIR